ncbi:MAG TPA: hypothetical protein DD737_07575, partial [Ruminococcaceae bacterium]|nr:hypothetical protein [Oscillospiraceae bacterium]
LSRQTELSIRFVLNGGPVMQAQPAAVEKLKTGGICGMLINGELFLEKGAGGRGESADLRGKSAGTAGGKSETRKLRKTR